MTFWQYLLYALWPALLNLRPAEQDMSKLSSLQPTYFVEHPDGSHTVADPQPVAVVNWSESAHGHVSTDTYIEMLTFVIQNAPLMSLPVDDLNFEPAGTSLKRLSRLTIPYAYINSKTWRELSAPLFPLDKPRPDQVWFHLSEKSPTKWVPLDFIPEGNVIFTPNRMPGITGL